MTKRFTINDALTVERDIRRDIKTNLINFNYFPIFTFKKNYLRCNAECSSERLNEVRKCLNYCYRSCGGFFNTVRPKDMVYFLKDEVSHGNWHVHVIVDLNPLIKKGIPTEWFWRKVNDYWSTVFDTYLKTDSWNELKKMVREPRHGWMKVLRSEKCWVMNDCNKDTLIDYQTKCVKDYYIEDTKEKSQTIVSNLEYFPSYGLLEVLKKRSNELGTKLLYLKRI